MTLPRRIWMRSIAHLSLGGIGHCSRFHWKSHIIHQESHIHNTNNNKTPTLFAKMILACSGKMSFSPNEPPTGFCCLLRHLLCGVSCVISKLMSLQTTYCDPFHTIRVWQVRVDDERHLYEVFYKVTLKGFKLPMPSMGLVYLHSFGVFFGKCR